MWKYFCPSVRNLNSENQEKVPWRLDRWLVEHNLQKILWVGWGKRWACLLVTFYEGNTQLVGAPANPVNQLAATETSLDHNAFLCLDVVSVRSKEKALQMSCWLLYGTWDMVIITHNSDFGAKSVTRSCCKNPVINMLWKTKSLLERVTRHIWHIIQYLILFDIW